MTEKLSSHFANYDLAQWLSYIESIHPTEIDMGLERISSVFKRLSICLDFATVITVAGTNGKGTTCAFMENALISEGHKVAVYSSPHIVNFNERLRINKTDVTDTPLVEAFNQIEQARQDISLSYYEYTTLAAFLVLMSEQPDIIILEVGLGGRLDATNVIDADIAVITTIDLDHQAFLGNTREAIAIEKAGIMRSGKPAIIGDTEPPMTLIDYVNEKQIPALIRHEAFKVIDNNETWTWQTQHICLDGLVMPHIPRDNVATALMALSLVKVEITFNKANQWIENTKVAGRTELFKGLKLNRADVMLDVGHNPQAARYLKSVLLQFKAQERYKNVYAVFGMLKDKDIQSTLTIINDVIDTWYFGGLDVPRGANCEELTEVTHKLNIKGNYFDNVEKAFKMAQQSAQCDDLVLVFGSFFTVAKIRNQLVD